MSWQAAAWFLAGLLAGNVIAYAGRYAQSLWLRMQTERAILRSARQLDAVATRLRERVEIEARAAEASEPRVH